jgi:hypothetical protein
MRYLTASQVSDSKGHMVVTIGRKDMAIRGWVLVGNCAEWKNLPTSLGRCEVHML